jgi:ABC-type multidrug transport system ATPase subunit
VGFHPDLTGMENIFYHAAIHGLSREQVLAKLQAIIEFSGLRDYLYEPVKHYSSGMYARLGCSVALHLEPDIALVDEVLSVGDAEFRDRVHGRLRQMIDAGVTVFLVTHEVGTAADLCDELIWMDGGRIKTRGRPSEVVLAYGRDTARRKLPPDHLLARAIGELQAKMGESVPAGKGGDLLAEETRIDGAFAGPTAASVAASAPADSSFEIESARFLDERGDPIESVATGGTVRLETRVRALRAVDAAALRVIVWHHNGVPLSHHLSPTRAFERDATHCWRLRWSPTLWMCSEVFITVGVVDPERPDVGLHGSPLTLTLGVILPDMPQISMPHMVPARWRTQ